MPPEITDASSFSPDTQEFLRLLSAHEVRAVVVGGEAVIFYGHIRVTGVIDIYYDRSPENADRLFGALEEFWRGVIPELEDSRELEKPGVIFQFGVPPNRVDLLNEIDGVEFEAVWNGRTRVELQSGDKRINVEGCHVHTSTLARLLEVP